MPKTKISEFSATPANNTDIDSINIAEGCAPSGINDAIRELMAQLKDFQTGAVGDSFNGPVGTTTAAAGAFTTLSATGNVTLGDASTDTLNVGNGGLVKDASGLVQIGTTTAGATNAMLTVYNPNTTSAQIYLQNTGTGTGSANGARFLMTATDLTITNKEVGSIVLETSDTERMRLDSAGNLLLGVTSSTGLTGTGDFAMPNNRAIRFRNAANSAYLNMIYVDTSNNLNFGYGGVPPNITFSISNVGEAARIDSSGNLLVGSTTNTTNAKLILSGATRWAVGTQSGGNIFYIVRDSDGVGQYMVNGSTSWTATSDERLKDIIEPISDAASKVSTLRAVIGKFKKDAEGTRRSFLIAQDVQAVLPEAVTVQEDEFGTLGIQYTEVIPLLVAAIKEQTTLIESLKARLDAANL